MTKRSPKSPRALSDMSQRLLDRASHRVRLHGVSVAARLVLGLVGLIALGSLLLMLPGIGADRRLTVAEAVFTATSALTVTGLTIITPAVDLTRLGQLVLLGLIQIGGVGFMFVAVVVLQLLGRKVLLRDRLALADSLGLSSAAAILTLLRRVFVGVVAIEAVGALLLWAHWLSYFAPRRAAVYAIFHSVSAFCNAGFDLFHGAVAADGTPFSGIPTDGYTLTVMGTLIVLGGVGIPVIADLIAFPGRRRLTVNTRVTLRVTLGLILFGWLALFVSESFTVGVLADEPWGRRLSHTLFQSISNRTAGFAGLPDFVALRPASMVVIIAMMFVGCAPASMGGGITTGTFAVLVISLRAYAAGAPQATVMGRAIDVQTIKRAAAILTIALGLLALTTWLLLLTHPDIPLHMAVFEAVSAFATCGLSLGATGEFNAFGRAILMLLMFWGRLGPLSVVIAVAQRRDARRPVRYPEDQILIG